MVSSNDTWVLQLAALDQRDYESIIMHNTTDPKTWVVKDKFRLTLELSNSSHAVMFFSCLFAGHTADELWVSVQQDHKGRHKFVSLTSAWEICTGSAQVPELMLVEEEFVKTVPGSVLLYARPQSEKQGSKKSVKRNMEFRSSPAKFDIREYRWSNYSVIPQLSIGNNKMILCDENTLCSQLPDDRVFDNLVLIVNCHENKCCLTKYKVGTCSTNSPPAVICHAVHTWSRSFDSINRKCDEIQTAIWQALQNGSVAVHCLAGIHRAACIVACQYLYRHYKVGQKRISANHDEIYRQMIAVRPAVSPAYTHVLMSYEAFVKSPN